MLDTRENVRASATVLLEKDGRFVVYQPGLALIASGDSAEAAYRKFSDARRTFFEEIQRAGFPASLVTAQPNAAVRNAAVKKVRVVPRGFIAELGLFLAKTCIVLLVIAGLGGGLAVVVKQSVDRLAATINASTIEVSEFLKSHGNLSMVDVADKAAVIVQDVQAMPEERKQSLIQSVGFLSREMAPIVDAWRNPPPSPDGKSAPASQPRQ
jgi:hypothetical protein